MLKIAIVFCLLSSTKTLGQTKLDSADLFKDFALQGRTTAGAYSHFTDMINEGTETLRLSAADLKELNEFITHSELKKHRQTKFGQDNVFVIGYVGKKRERIVIASGRAIINLTLMQEYRLTEEHRIQLKELIDGW